MDIEKMIEASEVSGPLIDELKRTPPDDLVEKRGQLRQVLGGIVKCELYYQPGKNSIRLYKIVAYVGRDEWSQNRRIFWELNLPVPLPFNRFVLSPDRVGIFAGCEWYSFRLSNCTYLGRAESLTEILKR